MCSDGERLLAKMSSTVRSFCIICRKDFPSASTLSTHWKLVHTGKRRRFVTEAKFIKLVPFSKKRCNVCDAIFASTFSKNRHLQVRHPDHPACELKEEKEEVEFIDKFLSEDPFAEKVKSEPLEEELESPVKKAPKEKKLKKEKKDRPAKELRIVQFPFFFGWCDVAPSDSCSTPEKAS